MPNGGTRRGAIPAIQVTAWKRTPGTETSQYREEEKSTEITGVAASETVRRPNRVLDGLGVVGPTGRRGEASRSPLERGTGAGESPVGGGEVSRPVEFLSSARYEEPGAKPGGPPSKAKDSCVTDSGRVP